MESLFDNTPESDLKLAYDQFIKKLGKDILVHLLTGLDLRTKCCLGNNIYLFTELWAACILSDPRTTLLPEAVRLKSTAWKEGYGKHNFHEKPVDKCDK